MRSIHKLKLDFSNCNKLIISVPYYYMDIVPCLRNLAVGILSRKYWYIE